MSNATGKQRSRPSVVVKKIVSAPRSRVFDAWTKPEMMRHWYVGGKGRSVCTVDLRVGGKYTNEMFIEPDAKCSCVEVEKGAVQSFLHEGEYLEIVRPERLVFTWNSPHIKNTIVTVELREVPGGTEVTITHELNSATDCAGHTEGWTFALNGLAAFIG